MQKFTKPTSAVLRTYASKPFLVFRQKDPRKPAQIDAAAYDAYVAKVRQNFRDSYQVEKQQKDEESIRKFAEHREKVITHRLKKREVSINNIKRHQEVQEALSGERERQRRERNQKRINLELLQQQNRIFHLKKMMKESVNYVTPDTLDFVLNKQLNRSRIVAPTIFSDRIGIVDEAEHQRLVVAGERTQNPFPHHSPIIPKLADLFDVNLIEYTKMEVDPNASVEWYPDDAKFNETEAETKRQEEADPEAVLEGQ